VARDPITGAEADDAHTDAFRTWSVRREREGRRATLVDLYRLVADGRGVQPSDLPLSERRALWERATPLIAPGFEMVSSTDRPREPIEVHSYDPKWPETFKRWRSRLASCLDGAAARIAHVGSTSVPGLDAKPIVDIQVSVERLGDEYRYVPGCEAAGLLFRIRDDEHRFFRPPFGAVRDVHVHVCEVGSTWEREHLLFRDFLRTHPDARDAYAATKHRAAAVWRDDSLAYTDAKSGIILDTLDSAESWARLNCWHA
jgi:GrpB-like predicted nucleotidyltransferase (UPF0157 family)